MERLRPRDDAGFVSRLVLFVLISGLCGLLVAGVTLPVLGGLGLVARDSANGFESLPAELEIPPLPERSRILAADGSLIATFYYENRISVPISDVAPVMRKAVIAIEDSRFYDHGGIDLRGTVRALVNNQSGKDVQGGSTLTQQYVKQVLLETASNIQDPKKRAEAQKAATAQTYTRKLRELRYAVALEEQYSKQEILERYLNIAFFGASSYGVEAAAKRYFNTHARDLTLPQAALLAGIVQQPTAFDPTRNPDARPDPTQHRAGPDGPGGADPEGRRRRGHGHPAGAEPAQAGGAERLPGLQGRVLLRLRPQDDPQRQDVRRQARGPGPAAAARRPDHHHHPRPRCAGQRPAGAGRPREPDRRRRLRAGVGAAGHRADPGDGGEPCLRRPQEEGRDQVQPGDRPCLRRQQRLPGRVDVQGLRRGGGARGGLSVQLPDLLAVQEGDRGREVVRRHPHRPVGPGERVQQRERHLHAADRHRGLGQHLLRPARGTGRCLPAGAHRVRPRRDHGRRQAAGADQVVHPGHQPGVAAVDGRGLRDLRRPRHPLQLDRDPRGDRPVRQPAAGAGRPTASRCSTRTSRTA